MEKNTGVLCVGTGEAGNIATLVAGGVTGRRVAVVTDREVGALHLESLTRPLAEAGAVVVTTTVDVADAAKSIDAVKAVVSLLSDASYGTADLLIGLGGGSVLDAVGFTASLYRGGLPYIQVPTTLAAMTAVVGATAHMLCCCGVRDVLRVPAGPALTVVDPSYLRTLPKRQFANGMAQIVRLAWLCDPTFLEELERELLSPPVDAGTSPAVSVLSPDLLVPRAVRMAEEARRLDATLLRFGLQAGAVIEEHFRYMKYAHGEATALGMLAVTRSARLAALLAALGLAVRLEGVGSDTIGRKLLKAFLDNECAEGECADVRIVTAEQPGCPEIVTVGRTEAETWFAEAATWITA
jgi:3-dehydroquinate synthase